VRCVLAVLATSLACQAQGDVRAAEVVLRGEHDGVELTLTRTATGCVTDEALVITVSGDRTSAGAWTLGGGPTGRELHGPGGLVARIVDERGDEPGSPRRVSLLDPIGVPLARMSFEADAITILDGGRSPIARVERATKGFRLLALPAGDRVAATVTGASDPELAARLLVPAELPGEARALFACERLAAVTPAVK
jgi:hypothetical protein